MVKKLLAVVAVVAIVAGLWWFEPWTLFTRSTVNEELPQAVSSSESPTASSTPAEPMELTRGEFVTQEHDTSGTARIVELADGRRILRVEGFSTSDGPDLEVWLSDREAGGDWFKYDDGEYLSLGALKATDGSHNYEIPAEVDTDTFASAVIWCVRFSVSFGSAPLDAV